MHRNTGDRRVDRDSDKVALIMYLYCKPSTDYTVYMLACEKLAAVFAGKVRLWDNARFMQICDKGELT